MYIGSVRFYKHLILFILALLVLLPTVACFVLLDSNQSIKTQAEDLRAKTELLQYELEDTRGTMINDVNLKEDSGDEELPYQALYPKLYAEKPKERTTTNKTVYLTFDDGPSERTLEILSVLELYDIKATFFVIGKTDEASVSIMKKIVDSGHSIGMHTYSHDYGKIYASVESYLDDFQRIYDLIYQSTGVKPEIFRFPGGSINSYNHDIYQPLIAEMTRRGFTFFDWNSCNDDTEKNASKQSIIERSLSKLDTEKRYIFLMHDSVLMKDTVSALPDIINKLKEMGFSFDKLTKEVKPISFAYPE